MKNTEYLTKRHPIQHEAAEQEALFRWAHFMQAKYPEIELLFHIPNGGSRNRMEAANLKKQGVKAGVPDLFLPVPRGSYHGLFIELKYGKNTPSENQEKWLKKLNDQGYAAVICYGWTEAAALIETYLKMSVPGQDNLK